MAELVEF